MDITNVKNQHIDLGSRNDSSFHYMTYAEINKNTNEYYFPFAEDYKFPFAIYDMQRTRMIGNISNFYIKTKLTDNEEKLEELANNLIKG